MTRDDCLQRATPPGLSKGDVLREGRFFRNLSKDDIGKRYENDNADPLVFGWKVKRQHWKGAGKQEGGYSVNAVACIHTPACSLAIDRETAHHVHVLEIDLPGLSNLIETPLVAQYDPIDDPANPCHFEVISEDRTLVEALMLIRDAIETDFPPGRKMPKIPKELAEAYEAIAKYDAVFTLYLSVAMGPPSSAT